MEEDLKPCPFCGRRVEMQYKDGSWGHDTITVGCAKCKFLFTEAAEAYSFELRRYVYIREEAKSKLRMRWNTRDGSDQQRIAELESMNARLAFPHIKMGVDGQAYLHHGEPTEYRAHFSVTEDAMASVPLKVFEREIRQNTEHVIRQMLAKAAEIQNRTKAGEEQ